MEIDITSEENQRVLSSLQRAVVDVEANRAVVLLLAMIMDICVKTLGGVAVARGLFIHARNGCDEILAARSVNHED